MGLKKAQTEIVIYTKIVEVGSYTKIVLCLDPASFVPSERASYIRDEVKVLQSFVKCKRLDFYDTQ